MKPILACIIYLSVLVFPASYASDPWPTNHPSGAISKTFTESSGASVNLWFWWWGENLLVEAIPVPANGKWPNGISGWGEIIQSGTQHTFLMRDEAGDWPKIPLYVKKVFRVVLHMDDYQLKSSEDSVIFLTERRNDAINIPKSGGGQGKPVYQLSIGKTGLGTITSKPAGIDCGIYCFASFEEGTTVSLTALPDAGQSFEGWSGACSGKTTCLVTMDRAKSVAALFASAPSNSYSLNIQKKGAGSITSIPAGIDCGIICSASFATGTSVTLSATPAEGYTFNGWSGACNGTGPCVVNVNTNKIVIATFGPPVILPSVTANIPSDTAFVKQPFDIGWQLTQIKKGRPVRVKFAKDGVTYKIIKAAKANAAGVGAFRWKPRNAQRTENGLIQVCAVPSKGAAEVCSTATYITVQ